MSSWSLRKKLQPAKKAWKGLTSTLQTKLTKVKRSKPIKNTKKRLTTTLSSLLPRPPPPHLRRKTRPRSTLRPRNHHRRSFAPVYVNELFKEPVSSSVKLVDPPDATATTDAPSGDASIDEKAEQFISMFREEMRVQRQRSFREYQEMLARGAM